MHLKKCLWYPYQSRFQLQFKHGQAELGFIVGLVNRLNPIHVDNWRDH